MRRKIASFFCFLFKDNTTAEIDVNRYFVRRCDVQLFAKICGKHEPPKLVDFSCVFFHRFSLTLSCDFAAISVIVTRLLYHKNYVEMCRTVTQKNYFIEFLIIVSTTARICVCVSGERPSSLSSRREALIL